jgi:hypothetical protein
METTHQSYEVERSAHKILDDGNYPIWSMRMEADLVERKLWKYVSGANVVVEPKGDTADEKKANAEFWEKKAMARSRLIAKVSDLQLPHMVDRDPTIVWNELARIHRAQGFGSRLALRRRFWNARMLENERMPTWIARVKALRMELKSAGADIDDEDVILVLTNGLPPSFESIVIAIDGIPTDQVNLEAVIVRLRNEEGRKEDIDRVKREENEAYGNSAMHAQAERTNDVTCFECRKRGHYQSKCPELELRRKDGKPLRSETAASALTASDWEDVFAF